MNRNASFTVDQRNEHQISQNILQRGRVRKICKAGGHILNKLQRAKFKCMSIGFYWRRGANYRGFCAWDLGEGLFPRTGLVFRSLQLVEISESGVKTNNVWTTESALIEKSIRSLKLKRKEQGTRSHNHCPRCPHKLAAVHGSSV